MTAICKEGIARMFEDLGGVDGAVKWARKNNDNLTAFYTRIWTRLLPVQLRVQQNNLNVTYQSYDELRDEMIRRGLSIPPRLSPLPRMIEHDSD